ncbi:MAG TPA: EutN/CcmL family microcompartment protein, partial [Planctomycetota bacterium]|nr:EutN/CcmL family microcompartment protein [Planctomycetota bacterium]
MFVGTVQCEIELERCHEAFEGLRFLLVEPEHEVEWEGALLAVDTIGAQVGEMVIVALAPLGTGFDLPADLPIDGAVVGVVGSITS